MRKLWFWLKIRSTPVRYIGTHIEHYIRAWDIIKMFNQIDERGPLSQNHFNLNLWDRICPRPLTPRNCKQSATTVILAGDWIASSSSGFLKSNVWLCCIGCWLWNGDVSSDEQLDQAFWVLWRLTCCSQNTIAKAQQPIVTSHCLHVRLSRKRQCRVYRSPLHLMWHYKHVCVSAYTWRHKLEATLGWITSTGIIYQRDDGANA